MKTTYRRMNEYIMPDPALSGRVMEKVVPKARRILRPAALIAMVLAMVLLAVPVMAATIPAVNELMYLVSPEIAARFSPVQKSDTKAGVTMEVVSASVHGATLELYLSFQCVDGSVATDRIGVNEGDVLGRNLLLSGVWGHSYKAPAVDEKTGKSFQMLEFNHSFYSHLLGRNLTVDELYSGFVTMYVESVYGYNEMGEKVVIHGPWRVTFKIDESGYVGDRDDGVPQATSPKKN